MPQNFLQTKEKNTMPVVKNNQPLTRNDQIGENIGAFFVGAILAIMVMVFLGLSWASAAKEDGYKNAYIDYRDGSIEGVVKKRFPDLWVKYNAPDKPPEVK